MTREENRHVEPERAHRGADGPGLSLEDLELVAGGSPDQIRDALGGDATVNCFVMFVDKDE